jgi:hypothetical protein
MKIISLICSHTPKPDLLRSIIHELNKVSKTILFSGEEIETEASETIIHDRNTNYLFPYITRKWIYDNLDQDWDYVLYTEDDIFISEESVNNVLKMYETLPKPYVPGFIRYEYDERDSMKKYIDMHPAHSVHRGGPTHVLSCKSKIEIEDKLFWEPWNIHSGCWIFSKEDIKTLIENKYLEENFLEFGKEYFTALETIASVPYLYFTKVFPENFESVGVKHPNKYIYFSDGNPNEHQLKEILK